MSWNLAQSILPRHALFYAVSGETFDGKRAVELGLANYAVPKAKLREETVKFARKLMKLNPGVVRYTKEAIRAVRNMTEDQARDYLRSKQDSLARNDKVGDFHNNIAEAYRRVGRLDAAAAHFAKAAELQPVFVEAHQNLAATLRAQVFLCGALLGRAGRRLVLHLSTSWGGLHRRIPLLENILTYSAPTSPKLNPQAQT